MKLDHFLFLWRLSLVGMIAAAFRCQGEPPADPPPAVPVAAIAGAR